MAHVLVKNYTEQGGARTVIGGEIDVITGGAVKIAGTAITKTAAEINALPIVEQDAEADAKADYTTGDLDIEAEIIAAINATNTKINAILAKLVLANIIAAE